MDEPSYFATIPASVRYGDMSSSAKLMYGEITALCNKRGYCWATNSYFAELYQVDERTVSRWVQELLDNGCIKVRVNKESGNRREIEIVQGKIVRRVRQESPTPTTGMSNPLDENVAHNNISNSIDNNITNIASHPFRLSEEIHKLKTSSTRHISLIGEYLEEKKVDLRSKEQLKRAIARHLKDARILSDFTDEQIGEATKKAQAEVPAYTLGTLVKILTR